MSFSDVWEVYFERVIETIKTFKTLNESCETVFKSMWIIYGKIGEIVKKKGVLPPCQQFVSIYFRRNIVYLQSAHILACMGFSCPSMNLQRTVYETILRGYLFIVNHKEANLYHSSLRTEKEEDFLRKKRFYGHSFLREELFEPEKRKKHKEIYRELCISSHAEFKGLLVDFPTYDEKQVKDKLKVILSLAYGNIQMMTEGFFDLLDSDLKNVVKTMLQNIVESLENQVPIFEPDRKTYSSKIKLKDGNFMKILR